MHHQANRGDLAMVEAYRLYDRLQRLSQYPTYFVDNTRKNPGRVASDRGRDYTNAQTGISKMGCRMR